MSRQFPDRPNPCFKFLRRLQAGGRSNMYGAIPYLIAEFGCGRDDAFRIVCDWLDQQTALHAEQVLVSAHQDTASAPRRRSA